MKKSKLFFLSVSIVFFGISLFKDCFCTGECANSFLTLIFGILGIVLGGANLCWLANPLLLGSWISFFFNTKVSFVFSLIASLVSFMFLFAKEVAVDEAGTPRQIQSLEIGYWLWLISSIVMLVGNSFELLNSKAKTSANSG